MKYIHSTLLRYIYEVFQTDNTSTPLHTEESITLFILHCLSDSCSSHVALQIEIHQLTMLC